ncbi:MAG: hypothetical protein E7266_01645 [Lachnospiraceae bacterium]|nr:hypothetical protein [Lachnospiraceae bacterium]
MAWCPICNNEFGDSVNICEECNCLLLKGIPIDFTEIFSDKNEELVLNSFMTLTEAGFETAQYYCDADNNYHLIIDKENFDAAKAIVLEADADNIKNADDSMSGTNTPRDRRSFTYKNPSDKVADLKSSAYSLLLVGVLGAIFLVLEYFNVFNFNFSDSAHAIFYIVMSTLFGAFIIIGIASLVAMFKLKPVAEAHEKLKQDIFDYADKEFNKENANKAIEMVLEERGIEEPDELLTYYQRYVIIKKFITEKFEIEDEGFLDYLIEEIYCKNFDDEDDYDFEDAEIIDDNEEFEANEETDNN